MIIAVDFDGILCENRFPDIGRPNYEMVSFVRQLMDEGHEVILWTSRAGDRLQEAVEWCYDRGLHFCAVNRNAPSNLDQYLAEYPIPSPKVYADLYLEDHCPWFVNYGRSGCADVALSKMKNYARTVVDMMTDKEEGNG